MNKDEAEDIYYLACRDGILLQWVPFMIDEEFDLVTGGSDTLDYMQFIEAIFNLVEKYGTD